MTENKPLIDLSDFIISNPADVTNIPAEEPEKIEEPAENEEEIPSEEAGEVKEEPDEESDSAEEESDEDEKITVRPFVEAFFKENGWDYKEDVLADDSIAGMSELFKDRKSTCLNSSHVSESRMPSSA